MQKLMTVKVKQDVLMEASALGSQGWAWLTLLQSQMPGQKAGGHWHHALPTPKPPKTRG